MSHAFETTQDGESPVLLNVDGHVATVTLNRPERLNATTPEMRAMLIQILNSLDEDGEIRAIVLTGAGRAFCAGADLDGLQSRAGGAPEPAPSEPRLEYPVQFDTPIIAAVNGAVAGIGFAYAVMADVRFAAIGAKWTTPFARLGLVPELGLTWRLPRLVGTGAALEILMSGGMFTSEEAYRIGLVQRLLSPDEVPEYAQLFAQAVANNSPRAIRTIRDLVRADASRSWEDSFRDVHEKVTEAFQGDDFREAMTAQKEGRQPRFR